MGDNRKRGKRKYRKEDQARWNLATRYKLKPEDVADMIRDQQGRCAICEVLLVSTRMVIDHDHSSGKVRGLLCHACNIKLPVVEDAGWLMLAWAYLDEAGA